MATERRSVLGLVLSAEYKSSGASRQMVAAQEEFGEALLELERFGLDWHQHLRWRDYPNLFTDKTKPMFYREDGPVTVERLDELAPDKIDAAAVARGLLLQRRLNASWHDSAPTRSRPRM